jgi:microcystin-dependent protein
MTQVMVSVTPGMNWLGPWSATAAYAPTNVVSIAGSSYLCIAANTNQQPPNATYWNLVAASGAGGTPATSVTGPDAFGASPVVGTGTEFARQDHDHGLPSAPADLPLAGGTMSGAIAMGAHKITGMANGAAAQDAVAFGQLPSVPTPAASVTGPDAFGASTVVGISASYARQDHDHGLPASPFNWLGAWYSGTAYVAGDAVGSGGSSYICILGNINEVPPNATYWNLLAEEGTAGVPATSVTGPDAFGASAVVGVGTEFARQDHDHGLPASPTVPVGGGSIVGPDAFGASAAVGSAATWAASDHDHGLPAAPAVPVGGGSIVGPDAFGASAAVGSAATWAASDHDHGLPANPVPVGAIFMFPVAMSLAHWLLCNGATFSSSTYPALYALLGSTTLPNLQGLAPMGAGVNGVVLGASSSSGQMPSHTHTGPSHTHTGPSHTHTDAGHSHTGPSHTHGTPQNAGFMTTNGSVTVANGSSQYACTGFGANTMASGTGNTGSGTASLSNSGTGATGADGTEATGGAGSGSVNLPPYLGVDYYIKAA